MCSRTSRTAAPASRRRSRETSRRCWAFERVSTSSRVRDVRDQVAHPPLDLGHRRDQPRRARRLGEPDVEAHVGAAVVLEARRAGHPLDELLEAREVLGLRPLGGEHGRAGLDRHAVVEHAARLALEQPRAGLRERRRVGHERAARAPAQRHEVAALHERDERLAQRGARDPQLLGQRALGRQAAARGQQAEPDRRAQPLDGLLERGRRMNGLKDGRERRAARGGDAALHGANVHRLKRTNVTAQTAARIR